MSTPTPPPADPTPSPGSRETEYSAAVDMAMYESQLFWAIMGVFLLADTILAGFLLTAAPVQSPPALHIAGALLGVVTSWLWIAALGRSSAYHKLRIYQAREIEKRLDYHLFLQAGPFATGKSVIVD